MPQGTQIVKKTDLEKRAVIGLVVIFFLTFVFGPLRALGVLNFGRSKMTRPGADQVSMEDRWPPCFRNAGNKT